MYVLKYVLNGGEEVTEEYSDTEGKEAFRKYRLFDDQRFAPCRASVTRIDDNGNILIINGAKAQVQFVREKADGTWHAAFFKPEL